MVKEYDDPYEDPTFELGMTLWDIEMGLELLRKWGYDSKVIDEQLAFAKGLHDEMVKELER